MPAPAPEPFEYALIQVVPSVERDERFNAGVVLFCRPLGFLDARVHLDERRLTALAPAADGAAVFAHLSAISRICAGDPTAGPIARLSQSERFHWLVAPSSTIIQPAPVHAGLTNDPAATLDHLFAKLVMPQARWGANH